MSLTAERLREVLHYDPETGVFTWRVRAGHAKIGDVAGGYDGRGYRVIGVDGALYRAHRLAWLYTTGAWPADQIDHINGARDDNRFANLREATHRENGQNRTAHPFNTSGHPGVCWHKAAQKWMAQIRTSQKHRYLGLFSTPEEAAAAYVEAKRRLHTFQPEIRAEKAA